MLELLSCGALDARALISRRVPVERAPEAYRLLAEDRSILGIVLEHHADARPGRTLALPCRASGPATGPGKAVVAFAGAGNFATRVLLPCLAKTPARLKVIVSSSGASAALAGRKFSSAQASTDWEAALNDAEVNTVFIATPHQHHARMAAEALRAGKHVFIEKPLALSLPELELVRDAFREAGDRRLLVGFNRRFAPLAVKARGLLAVQRQPASIIYTVNAGPAPAAHWTVDPEIGGGRILGEACHFIDLLRFFIGQPIAGVSARRQATKLPPHKDTSAITVEFADGSIGTVHYLANGDKGFPKERVEIFSAGRILVLDNFRTLKGYGWPKFSKARLWRQDKGHRAEVEGFIASILDGGPPLMGWDEIEEITRAAI
ncbi:MAG: Gfo/Idh/MocA family oxidoreductase, partial [Elusimicrobia bacterium]|nr:Gfo/Idh/MocA family oxidoreductase [Elusimicrobiota bacterium]